MFGIRCAVVLSSLTLLGTATAAGQARALVHVQARVQNVEPSRKSLQVALELADSPRHRNESRGVPSAQRGTPYGAVSVGPAACGSDACPRGRIATITFW